MVLVLRLRKPYLFWMPLLFGGMLVRPLLILWTLPPGVPLLSTGGWGELSSLLLSVLALLALYTFQRVFSEYRETEGRLRRLTSIVEATTDFVGMADEQGRTLYINPAGRAMLGYGPDEDLSHKVIADYHPPDEQERIPAEMIPAVNERGAWTGEVRFLHRDGHQIPTLLVMLAHQDPLGGQRLYAAIARDITGRKQMEEELQRSKDRLIEAQRMARVGSFELDFETRQVRFSEEGRRIFGLPEGPVDFMELAARVLAPGEQERMLAELNRVVSEGAPSTEDYRLVFPDGTEHFVHARGKVVCDDDGRPLRLVGSLQDITEKKRAELEREELIRALEAKNAELERYTYTVSHDLKSPLLTIKGFLGLLEEDWAAGNLEQARDDMQRIHSGADTMQRLLDELLQLSRIGRVVNPPEALALTELATTAADQVRGRPGADRVTITIAPDLPTVWGDRTRLLEVFQNLFDNAVKFRGDEPDPRIEVTAEAQGDRVLCRVRDNGIGIRPAYQAQIFEVFTRLDNRVDGTGIGLALVRRIIEVHGGRIWVESDEGAGSTFLFTLPRPPA